MKELLPGLLCSLLLLGSCVKQNDTISLMYLTDAHEIAPVIDQFGNRGGVARLKGLINQRSKQTNTIVVFGGDLAGGTLFGGLYRGFPMVEAFNQIPVRIANFGQHEFDFGVDNTLELIQKSNFNWITSNLQAPDGRRFAALPDHYLLDTLGIKIGFIGLTDALETSISDPRVQQTDLLKAAGLARDQLQAKGADFIVAITQTSFSVNEKILQEVGGIDLIFTEEVAENRTVVQYIGAKPIIATCGNMGSVAEVQLRKTEAGMRTKLTVHPLDSTIQEDATLAALERTYVREIEQNLSTVLTLATDDFLDQGSRIRENQLGNLIADAFRDYYQADIGLMNGGGIRENILQGAVTLRAAHAVLPFHNRICLVELKGAEIVDLLQAGVEMVSERGGDFLQVAGLTYAYSITKAGVSNVVEVEINGQPMELERTYKVALSNFILLGNGNYAPIPLERLVYPLTEAPRDVEVLIDFLKKQTTISPATDGRIKVMHLN